MIGGGCGNSRPMDDWRYELAGLSAQERLRAVKVYEAVAEGLAAGRLSRSARAELRTVAAAEGLAADHPWIGAAAEELELSGRTPHAAPAGPPRTSARLPSDAE